MLRKLAHRIDAAIARLDPASPASRELWGQYAELLRKPKLTEADENRLVSTCQQLQIDAAMLDLHRTVVVTANAMAAAEKEHERARRDVVALDAELGEARKRFCAARRKFGEEASAIEGRRGEAWSRQQTAWESRRHLEGLRATFPELFGVNPEDISASERLSAVLPLAVQNAKRRINQ